MDVLVKADGSMIVDGKPVTSKRDWVAMTKRINDELGHSLIVEPSPVTREWLLGKPTTIVQDEING